VVPLPLPQIAQTSYMAVLSEILVTGDVFLKPRRLVKPESKALDQTIVNWESCLEETRLSSGFIF